MYLLRDEVAQYSPTKIETKTLLHNFIIPLENTGEVDGFSKLLKSLKCLFYKMSLTVERQKVNCWPEKVLTVTTEKLSRTSITIPTQILVRTRAVHVKEKRGYNQQLK